jgi:hypothetical protein
MLLGYGNIASDGYIMASQSADHQSNRQPNPFFVHAATFGGNLKKRKIDKLRAGFYAGKNAGKFTAGLRCGFCAGFSPDRGQKPFDSARRYFQTRADCFDRFSNRYQPRNVRLSPGKTELVKCPAHVNYF